jgi:hypothetical protein
MCIGTVAAIGLIGGIVSAAGTVYAGIAQKQSLDYQSQVAANNAITAQQNAKYAIEAGAEKTAAVSLQEAERGGEIKAAQAASGTDVNTGSNKDVQVSQRELGKLNTLQEMNKAQQIAYGYRTQATNFQAQSQLYGYEAPQAEIGADIGAAGQVFGAAAKWYGPTPGGSPYNTANPTGA